MRKKVLGLFMAALAVSSIGAFAQSESRQSGEEVKKECCKEKKEKKECHKLKKECKERKDFRKEARVTPFKGIQLSAEQQAQIDQINAERKANQKKIKADKKDAFEKERQAYDEQIAKVLTPEQYKLYENNKANMRAHKQDKMKKKLEKMVR